ncbi:ribosome biogenesis GTPase Der [Hyphomicrobium sp.]|uniref:ribosome biogenesis GTPase Der n=1 Tax=Hyphomicrobium sp. TaxID=82 RepID=UPI002C965C8E|nr:ribosome biogenesis GTPase Der [Hyphomicrobium sp.]HRN87636.1 ribosome biogenesis GTPase Der [Hyphomicrobium sp.]HRQ27696.1 ribosome biogenesis GTPase Der [Hyphomicrobium sp.]
MTPKIAIVGRPNVGKSTLFNRLTGTRAALVSDLPGLTRDRKEGEADLGGHMLNIVDTAGLEEAAEGSIPDRMRRQTEAAIETADLVLFVIDARDGVTATDETFARTVRASGRPVVLVANKCEGRRADEGFYDAFRLGLGEPVAISAEHGLGLIDLERDALAALGLEPKPHHRDDSNGERTEKERPLRVAIVGRPNAGKSTLVNALVGEDRMITGPEPGLTRDTVSSDITWSGRAIRLFDTAGLRRKAKVTDLAEKLSTSDTVRAIRFAEVVVLLIDAERGIEHQDLTIADLATEEGRAFVIAVNKWDLVEDKQQILKGLTSKVSDGLSQVPGVAVVPISAASEKGLDKLLKAIVRAAEIWNRRVPTHELNRWLGEALARHAPPAPSGRRLKIRYVTQPSTRPPTFVAFCSRPEAVPKTYLKYLTNSLRTAFGLPGVPIRFNLRKGDNPFASKGRRG